MKIKKIWDDYIKPIGVGIGVTVISVLPGCGDVPAPEYRIPKTKIEDNYSKTNSNILIKELKEELKNISYGYETIEDKSESEDWEGVVNQELAAINKATSLAVRSVKEKENHDYEYPAANDSRRNYLDTRLNALLYNQNTAIDHVLDNLQIDPMLQTIMKNDSVSIGDYLDKEESPDGKERFLEYRINFLEGGEKNFTDNGKLYFEPRTIRFSVYNWDKNALGVYGPSSAEPQLEFSAELDLDFANNNYTFRDVMELASKK